MFEAIDANAGAAKTALGSAQRSGQAVEDRLLAELRPAVAEDIRRIGLLAELGVLDTDPEPSFDALTHAAAALTRCPIALISLVDGDRQWFKSRVGLDQQQTPRAWSFCSHAIRTPHLMEVPDAAADLRFASNPLVVGDPGIRFYAGQPLELDGVRIGTLCVIDTTPRTLTLAERAGMQDLARVASALLADRRKRAVTAEQQRRLTAFALVAGDWLWETDVQHRLVWISSAYANQPPLTELWQLGQAMDDAAVLESPDFPANAPTTLHRLLDARGGFARALVRSDAGSMPRYLSHSAVSWLDSSGHWAGYRGITRDLTANVTAALAHREASNLLADLSAQVPGVIFQMLRDVQGRFSFRYVSERVSDTLELAAGTTKAHPKSILRRLRRVDVLPLMRAIRQSAQGRTALRHTCQVDLPRAGRRDVQIHAAPTQADSGGVLWHGVLTDITEQLLAALQLQSLAALDLEAQRKTAMRNEFLSRVSHEFRTPLNAILGFSQLIRLQGLAQPMAALLGSVQHIEHAGTHLLALVNDMLDLAGLEAGSAAMHLEPVLLAPLVEESVALLGPLAQHRRISFQVSQTGHIPAVQGDERAVRQILFNLLGNAIKFAHLASVVQVQLRQAPGTADVAIEITDEGPGIAADALASLFMPFPGGNVARNHLSGTGLGLPISLKLARAMGGRIDVRSLPGQGTTFTVVLGVAEQAAAGPSGQAQAAGPPEQPALPVENRTTVLYVEDDVINAMLMEAVFDSAALGHLSLAIAQNGASGIAQARSLMPALVLLDMQLPDMSGLDVLAELRRDRCTAAIRVIGLSSDAMPEQISKALLAGCDDYWTKPINFSAVVAALVSLLPAPRPGPATPPGG